MRCCGVNSYIDWCECKNLTQINQFKMYSSSSPSQDYKITSSQKITSLKEDVSKHKDKPKQSLNYDNFGENCSESYVEQSENSDKYNKSLAQKEKQAVSYTEKEQYNIVECFIPDSCCIIKEVFKFNPVSKYFYVKKKLQLISYIHQISEKNLPVS